MKTSNNKRTARLIFGVTLALIVLIYGVSLIRTGIYNRTIHHDSYTGDPLFVVDEEAPKKEGLSIKASARTSTWTKIFDLENTGLTTHTHQAYTYDFQLINNTKDSVSDFTFKLTFDREVFLMSAWNGSLEIHQNLKGGEYVATVPDLREFDASLYSLDTVVVDGDTLIRMKPGDYLIYQPCTSATAPEIPIKAYEGTTPGIILYIEIGKNMHDSVLDLDYHFHRRAITDPLFMVATVGIVVWLIVFTIFAITSAQIRKYNLRHERDNEIIQESIETFTGFIDAKDQYTNGHSNRVAAYTRLIAKEMGYSGEELDRIYYVALLHDCGKIGVPDNILSKPAKLDDDEFEIIKSHTIRGGEILSHFKSLPDVDEGAVYHHERYDGKGYPEGKAGEDIPLIARMICVADSFDAMNSNRVYRRKLSREHILDEIRNNKGKQFDPKIADILLELIKEGKITIAE